MQTYMNSLRQRSRYNIFCKFASIDDRVKNIMKLWTVQRRAVKFISFSHNKSYNERLTNPSHNTLKQRDVKRRLHNQSIKHGRPQEGWWNVRKTFKSFIF